MAADAFPTQFPEPVKSYDAHIYFFQGNPASADSARALRDTIIEKFPHLEVYKFWEKPIGPHPTVSHPGLGDRHGFISVAAPFSSNAFSLSKLGRENFKFLEEPNRSHTS
jgi:hypothetical protein